MLFRSKTVKIEKQKTQIFWNTEFYHPAKLELKRIKNAKVVTTLQLFACVLARREEIEVTNLFSHASFLIQLPFKFFQCSLGLCKLYCQKGFQENYCL